ncbi:MAG TPA: tetratricopeptide repeat protein [Nitrospirota bacterium]|nr:tetratricopeptide repeat protein [Nitrospirota bacterium]
MAGGKKQGGVRAFTILKGCRAPLVANHGNLMRREEIMKKIVVSIVLILIAAGCTQQKQEQKGQGGFPQGAAQMVTPGDIKLLEEKAKANPKNADTWAALGNALYDSARFSEAIDAYQKSLNIDPKNVDVRVDMGTCYRNIHKPELALEEYRKALKLNPNHPYAHRNSGIVLAFDLNDKAQGISEFEKYLAIAPNDPYAGQTRQLLEQLKTGK